MKNKLRLTSLFLALLLLASLLGCSMPGIGTDSGESTSEKATTTLPPEDIVIEETTWNEGEPAVPDTTEYIGVSTEPVEETTESLPDTIEPAPETTEEPYIPILNYGGEHVRILYGNEAKRNEFNPDESGEIIDDTVYRRNAAVENLLNVKFEWTGMAANANLANEYVQHAENLHYAGVPYDIYAATRRAMSQMLIKAFLCDFNKIDHSRIDLEKPWYPKTLREDLTLGGANFFVTGDISANALMQMNAIFYNIDLANKLGYTDIANKVKDGSWNMMVLLEFSQDLYVDTDGSDRKSDGDSFGFCQAAHMDTDAFYTGAGLNFYDTDPTNEKYVIPSPDLNSERSYNLSMFLNSIFSNFWSYVAYPLSQNGDCTPPFAAGRALFCQGYLGIADGKVGVISKLDFEYGILPIPKFGTEQQEYFTALTHDAVFWGIHNYSSAERALMSSAVIEAMAETGYNTIVPAVFENVMKKSYFSDSAAESREIYDLLRATIKVDIGKFFSETTSGLQGTFANSVKDSNNPMKWKTTISSASFATILQRGENELNNIIKTAIENQDQ